MLKCFRFPFDVSIFWQPRPPNSVEGLWDYEVLLILADNITAKKHQSKLDSMNIIKGFMLSENEMGTKRLIASFLK